MRCYINIELCLICEDTDLAIKKLVKTNLISKNDFKEFSEYIAIKPKTYFYFQLFLELKKEFPDRHETYGINLFKELNEYYKDKNRLLRINLLESETLNFREYNLIFGGGKTISDKLKNRRGLLNMYSALPSKYRRNINKIINNSFNFYEFTSQLAYLREILTWVNIYSEFPDTEIKAKIINIAFSSRFDNLNDINVFLNESYQNDLNFVLQNTQEELFEFIKTEGLEKDIKVLKKSSNGKEVVIQVFSHNALKKLTCNTKWCFSRSNSENDWLNYARNKWVILIYNFFVPHPHSLTVILPNFEAYDANNILIKGERNEREAGAEFLSAYLPQSKVEKLKRG